MAMAVRSKSAHWACGNGAPDGRGAEAVVDDLVARTPDVVRTARALLARRLSHARGQQQPGWPAGGCRHAGGLAPQNQWGVVAQHHGMARIT